MSIKVDTELYNHLIAFIATKAIGRNKNRDNEPEIKIKIEKEIDQVIDAYRKHTQITVGAPSEKDVLIGLGHMQNAVRSFALAFRSMSDSSLDTLLCHMIDAGLTEDEHGLINIQKFHAAATQGCGIELLNSTIKNTLEAIRMTSLKYAKLSKETNYNTVELLYGDADIRLAINLRHIVVENGIKIGKGAGGILANMLKQLYRCMGLNTRRADAVLRRLMEIEKSLPNDEAVYLDCKSRCCSVPWQDLVDANGDVKQGVLLHEPCLDADSEDFENAAIWLSRIQLGSQRQKRRTKKRSD